MKHMLMVEIKRCFTSKRFLFALLFGIIISVLHVALSVYPLVKWLDAWEKDAFLTPHSAYGHWIGMDLATIWPTLLYFLLPCLGAIPFAETGFWDYNSGYCIQLYCRQSKKICLITKFFVVFLSGFAITAGTLLFDFLFTSQLLPQVRPEVITGLFSCTDRTWQGGMLYSMPLLYTLMFIFFDAGFIGLWTTLSLSLMRFIKSRVQAVLLPSVMYLMLFFIGQWVGVDKFVPFSILLPFQPTKDVTGTIIIVYLFILLGMGAYGYFYKEYKKDVL